MAYDRAPPRKTSKDSTRSRHRERDRDRPSRQGSSDSTSSHRSHRERDRDRRPPRRPTRGSSREYLGDHELDTGRMSRNSTLEDPPPPYSSEDKITKPIIDEKADTREADEKKKKKENDENDPSTSPISLPSRIVWSSALLIPLLASTILLFLITCSSETLRADFSVLKIGVSGGAFDLLYQTTQTAGSSDNSTSPLAGLIGRSGNSTGESGSEGFLTLGIWGWCVSSKDGDESACSTSSGWYNMKDALSSAPQSGMNADVFSSILVHGLILHGFALISDMLAIVPAILNNWRRYHQNNTQYEAGWFQHGTILAASILAAGAWVIDKILSHNVTKSLSGNSVKEGPAVILVGISALLLFISFLISAIPVLYRFVDHQAAYIKKWSTVEDSSAEAARARQAIALADLEAGIGEEQNGNAPRRRKGRRRRDWKNRMTRMFIGDDHSRRSRRRRR